MHAQHTRLRAAMPFSAGTASFCRFLAFTPIKLLARTCLSRYYCCARNEKPWRTV
jgi:hypothetical protein